MISSSQRWASMASIPRVIVFSPRCSTSILRNYNSSRAGRPVARRIDGCAVHRVLPINGSADVQFRRFIKEHHLTLSMLTPLSCNVGSCIGTCLFSPTAKNRSRCLEHSESGAHPSGTSPLAKGWKKSGIDTEFTATCSLRSKLSDVFFLWAQIQDIEMEHLIQDN